MLIFSLILLLLIIFFSLIFLLRKIMIKNVVSATQHLDQLSKDYQKKQQQLEDRIKEVENQAKKIISDAEEEAERLKAKIIQDAEEERDRIIEDARTQSQEIIQQAEKSRQALISEIEERINKEAIKKACDLIKDTLPQEFKEAVHNRWVEELLSKGFEEFSRLKVPEEIKEAEVISAFPLTENQKKNISKKLKEIFKRELNIKEKEDPEVVAGIIINIGNLVLDGSLSFKIKEVALRR